MLVMLIDRATTGNIYMQYSRESVYNINSIQQKMDSQTCQHILNAHAITGCDTISAMYSIGTKKAIDVLDKGDWNMLDVFMQSNASADETARVGELFLLRLYNAKQSVTALDKYMHQNRYCSSYLVDVKQYATRDAPCMPEILVQTSVLLMVKTLSNKIVKRIGEKPAIYAIIQAYNYVITMTHFKFDT